MYIFVRTLFKKLLKKRSNMGLTKIYMAHLSFPCQELSNGGLEIVVALTVFAISDLSCACTGGPIQL